MSAGLTRDAKEALLRYDWPGNVRELRNVMERACVLCPDDLLRNDHCPLGKRSSSPSPNSSVIAGPTNNTNATIVESG